MYIYAGTATIVAVIAGIIMSARTKKAEGVIYENPDKAARITNNIPIPVYSVLILFL